MVYKKRVTAKTIEVLMLLLMSLFFIAALLVPYKARMLNFDLAFTVIIEMLILVIVSIFGMMYLLAKLWEMHVYGEDSSTNHQSRLVAAAKATPAPKAKTSRKK